MSSGNRKHWPVGRLMLAALQMVLLASSSNQAELSQDVLQSSGQLRLGPRDAGATQQVASKLNATSAAAKTPSGCVSPCSSAEFSAIIQRLTNNDDILASFRHFERQSASAAKSGEAVRAECVRELVGLIKGLASGELEMKSVLEFASGSGPLAGSYQLVSAPSKPDRPAPKEAACADRAAAAVQRPAKLGDGLAEEPAPAVTVGPSDGEKSRLMPRLVARVDGWIDTLERFTLTREWSSLLRLFQGSESILAMFVQAANGTQPAAARNATATNSSASSPQPVVQSSGGQSDDEPVLAKLRQSLPGELQTLTGSLADLFPWHVWPWNNLDLYTTTETFLNHGIFAFSKTTSGPERRIDYLAEMLQTLFKSLRIESFPKKCADWSKVICDPVTFHERLVLGPADEPEPKANQSRQLRARELASAGKNQLTAELTCIMFSSLSMQQFGGAQEDSSAAAASSRASFNQAASSQRLAWDKLVHKGLKLYSLAREALSDSQWAALYKLLNELWTQQKISDRVIMVGRVVQLLTNCHMPKEMLESALWKDIYKYKNALNQLSDIVIEELNRSSETGKFSIEQLSLGSKHLEEILVRLLRLLPKLVESLSLTVTEQLPELVGSFFADKAAFFKGPCKGHSLSALVASLRAHKSEIVELEGLICSQLRTKPSISMMQINNLTNELLAMAFNFTNLPANSLALPDGFLNPLGAQAAASGAPLASSSAARAVAKGASDLSEAIEWDRQQTESRANVSSIIDEMAANPRLAAIVAILQSSPLDPPEVHAELPELDWVEAGTSVALLYESVQRLLSFEGQLVVFPEVEQFQAQLQLGLDASRRLFKRFAKRDPIRLAAYALDASMPVAVRTFRPMESFHAECQSTIRDLFSQTPEVSGSASAGDEARELRQWQCLISSLNFAAYALDKSMETFNSMLSNVVAQISTIGRSSERPDGTCVLLDGTLARLLDSWPQVMELALESVLVAATSSPEQQVSPFEAVCASNLTLDPFKAAPAAASTRQALCRLMSKSSLQDCAKALKFEDWKLTMRQLNATWFETNAVSVEPAFRATTVRLHDFLILFGRAKPNNWSDSLLARAFNVNSFWNNLLNSTVGTIEQLRRRKLELALQSVEPIIYDNLVATNCRAESPAANATECRARGALLATIAAARTIASHINHLEADDKLQVQLRALVDWADEYAVLTAEVVLQTIATNITKLEGLLRREQQAWPSFCSAPVDAYLELASPAEAATNSSDVGLKLRASRDVLCAFDWPSFEGRLLADSNRSLSGYPLRRLLRVALTKVGQTLDLLVASGEEGREPPFKFARVQHWQHLHYHLAAISPLREQPSNFIWIWRGLERLLAAADAGSGRDTPGSLARTLEQLNCALDAVKGGLSWDNLANIYQDRQEILAAHSTINNGFALASVGVSTFLAPRKFQRLLDEFIRPIKGGVKRLEPNATSGEYPIASQLSFCEMRNRTRWESILSLPNEASTSTSLVSDPADFSAAIESFQELICDTNFETLPQSINPISVCYQQQPARGPADQGQLADTMDRSFKLASLAAIDTKLVATNDARPPIFDKAQWASFWSWWSAHQAATEPKSSLAALAVVRAFQTLDSMNSAHVVWRAVFKSVHEFGELVAYVIRASERHSREPQTGARLPANDTSSVQIQQQSQRFVSTISSIIFPEANNQIPLRTFKQLRYIKSIADYFASTPGAQEAICQQQLGDNSTKISSSTPKMELIGYKLNTNAKLHVLLCHYHSSQWLTALNIVISSKTPTLTKKVNLMTKYLSSFVKQYKHYDNLESFVHARQMDSIETVANSTISHLLAASRSLRGSLTLNKLSNVSWHSLPQLFDSIDAHLCDPNAATKLSQANSSTSLGWIQSLNLNQYIQVQIPISGPNGTESSFALAQSFLFEPRKPDIETLVCQLPQWNISKIYEYLIENFDLQNMISLVTQTATSGSGSSSIVKSANRTSDELCISPFKVAAKWLRVTQATINELTSKSSRDRMRKCLSASTKGQSFCTRALRYNRIVNKILASVNELTATNSWSQVRKTWNSVSHHLLNQNAAQGVLSKL